MYFFEKKLVSKKHKGKKHPSKTPQDREAAAP
jgi:hypothetical protein